MNQIKLIKSFDENDNFTNTVIPLTLDVSQVFYIYHHDIDEKIIDSCTKVLKRNRKKMTVKFLKINEEDSPELDDLLKDEDIMVDISSSRYLSILLLEKAVRNRNKIVYYDNEERCIKTYFRHKVISDHIFSYSIEDLLQLNSGTVKNHMHKPASVKDRDTAELIKSVVEYSLGEYPKFISFIQRVNSAISNKKSDGNSYHLSMEAVNKIRNDDGYQRYKQFRLFSLSEDRLTFMNPYIAELFSVSGSFLENYLYLKLTESGLFDDVRMSVIIDFSGLQNRYPITCEIDCLVLKDNHLLFVSCKSNKVETADLNEIKVHNTIFGNDLSHPVVCTLEDLSERNPSVYIKGRELNIAILDKTVFLQDRVAETFDKIVNGIYQYEKV